jgi:acrylyl-CoA reductase (NADPH)
MPFILRNVSLLGIDSVMAPPALRERAWRRLAEELSPTQLATMVREITLGEAIGAAQEMITGRARGRTVVRIAA